MNYKSYKAEKSGGRNNRKKMRNATLKHNMLLKGKAKDKKKP